MATAQVQKGFVRTTGNVRQTAGDPLSGVAVKALGSTNEALSDRQGKVDIRVESEKEGQAYQLLSVHKKGHELNDPMLIGRTLAYSSKTPLEIIMVSSKELNRVKTEIEERVNQEVQQKYSQAMAMLNDSLNKEQINVEQFRNMRSKASSHPSPSKTCRPRHASSNSPSGAGISRGASPWGSPTGRSSTW